MRLINADDVLSIVDDLRDRMTVEGYCAMIERVKALPSATCGNLKKPEIPQHSEGEAADCNLDCISRQEAIRVASGYCHPANIAKELAKLPSAQPERKTGRWIPCSERLPFAEYGESDTVLTTCGYKDVEDTSVRWIRLLYFNGGNWCYPTGGTYEQKVYAWQPLPECYREGD